MTSAPGKSDNKVRAVVLAAGLGKRMRSSTAKVLHPVLGKPIIWRVLKTLDELTKQGTDLEQIHIVIGHNAPEVENYVKQCIETSQLHCPITFHKQDQQLGTGHALMTVQSALNEFQGNVLVVPGDCPLLTSDILGSLILHHKKQGSKLTILSTELDKPTGYGRILRSTTGEVLGIVEEKDASEKQRLS